MSAARDLREWLAILERQGELVRVAAEVDPHLEMTEIVDRTVKAGGPATLASVTDARSKLIAYGQPALKLVRDHSSPMIADTFHAFLLSLYDSLAAAATPPPARATGS